VPGMLGQARQKSAGMPVHWIVGDMRHFHLDLVFRLIFLTGNAFQALLTRPDQEAMLACVRNHLHAAGVFAFDTRNPRPAALRTISVEKPWWTYTDPQGTRSRSPGANTMTMCRKSCIGPPSADGRAAMPSKRVSRASPRGMCFPKNWKHCCITMGSRLCGNMAIGRVSDSPQRVHA
jgi:hypothetical protein